MRSFPFLVFPQFPQFVHSLANHPTFCLTSQDEAVQCLMLLRNLFTAPGFIVETCGWIRDKGLDKRFGPGSETTKVEPEETVKAVVLL